MRIVSFDRWLLVVGLACAVLIAASAAPSGQGQAAPAVCDNKCREILVFIKNNGFEDCGVNDLYACNRCGANGLCASRPGSGTCAQIDFSQRFAPGTGCKLVCPLGGQGSQAEATGTAGTYTSGWQYWVCQQR